ncbi:uncharacterized protein NEPG_02082 [Nematocida parisii ERTm1]|uniref:C3H1-type domain-containing protein n=1 Tax=Nematocida parisii (strain ERTm3) TaxID=935791 RepID=I3EFB1_NEMP3|nr:uncharacterized protein NEPG_02082 [Nematocida parisii ERTm1]EIJ87908.1 hypothetical protein NEQG_01980 [Nematocida parisii ERTm3]EIJ93126.1 hypothetical protein NEPG_02082 [Nematocida parisii ERTm1]KAI5146420.1 butyrate response factor [Nematocida parisii]KAI5159759.1 butyrate response factor [Nematocida parisii]|eukprot:XP_013059909.1 hypothetical protein NEPG_02082 [Nematocida parisii ERTm1]
MDRQEIINIQVNTHEYEEINLPYKERKRPKKVISKKKISLYKTEICKSFESSNYCTYGDKCQFAHSLHELRDIERHPRYKTELCKTYTTTGECTYGKRCCFIHAGPSEDIHTDLQDARNLPGDWKVPGVHDKSIEMCRISEDNDMKISGYIGLSPDELDKIKSLSVYKVNTDIMQTNYNRVINIPSVIYVSNTYSTSNIWVKPYFCYIYVDALCKVSNKVSIGKSPGLFTILKDYTE